MKYLLLLFTAGITGFLLFGTHLQGNIYSAGDNLNDYKESLDKIKNIFNNPDMELSDLDEETVSEMYEERLNELGVLDELGFDPKELSEVQAPVIQKILKQFKTNEGRNRSAEEIGFKLYSSYIYFLEKLRNISHHYLLAALTIFLAALVSKASGTFFLSSFIGKTGLFIGRLSILSVSLTAIFFWIALNRNLWTDTGLNAYIGPMELILGSCLALKSYDPNFPIWNKLTTSLILPIISFIVLVL